MNALDKIISFVSPGVAARRLYARAALEIASRKFDAATKGRRTDGWTTSNQGPNSVLESALPRLRGRSRDMMRNNGYAANGVKRIANNVVGTGIQPLPLAQSAATKKKVMTAWKEWAEKTACDFNEQMTVYGIQSSAMRAIVRDGEVLIRRRRDSGYLPIQLQVCEADFLDTNRNNSALNDGGSIIQGVEYNKSGKRVAYWMYESHPNDNYFTSPQSVRIPADDIIHCYYVDRPGQVRGIPFFTPVMLRLNDFDDYEDAELMRQKIAACFTVFVQDANPETSGLSGSDATLGIDRVEPGIIEVLPAGKTVEFANPPTTQNYDGYKRGVLQSVAAGAGITYEALTGDLSNVNFSSGRMGWIEMSRNVEDWQYNMLIPQMCDKIWKWFVEAAFLAGKIPSQGVTGAEWTPPRREMIDPTREIPALINGVRGSLYSLQEVHRQMGYNSDDVLQQIKDDNDKLDKLGIISDSDARKTMKAGVAQPYIGNPDGTVKEDPPADPPLE